jgi:hypothetical protein
MVYTPAARHFRLYVFGGMRSLLNGEMGDLVLLREAAKPGSGAGSFTNKDAPGAISGDCVSCNNSATTRG